MKPTIYDVAREAKVSIATVSKVLNKTGRISDETRRRVIQAMETLSYQPSVLASALTGKRTNTIALLIPDLANPFFAEMARSVEDRAQELGFSIVMCSTDNNSDKEARYISLLKQKSVDGFIFASGFSNKQILKQLIKEKFPVVFISKEITRLPVDSITVDDFLGGYQATEHLITLGHKRIAVVAHKEDSSKARINGFRQALKDSGLDCDDSLVCVGDSTIGCSRQLAGKLLDSMERPTAIFACNDLLAVGVVQAAKERGLIIPDDLSVVGFDNTILATSMDPPLTSVAQPIQEMGSQVIDLLIQRIEGKKNMRKRISLLPELVIRNSTKPPGTKK